MIWSQDVPGHSGSSRSLGREMNWSCDPKAAVSEPRREGFKGTVGLRSSEEYSQNRTRTGEGERYYHGGLLRLSWVHTELRTVPQASCVQLHLTTSSPVLPSAPAMKSLTGLPGFPAPAGGGA